MTRWHSAADIVRRLGGRMRAGGTARCRCPVKDHSSKDPLAVSQTNDGRVLLFCHAGCDNRTVIEELRRMGLWGDGELVVDPNYPAHLTTPYQHGVDTKTDHTRRQESQDIWDSGRAIAGTHAEAYLRARGIRLPPSDQLRFCAALYHSPTRQKFPALVARISDASGFCAVQRTYLDPAAPRKAHVGPAHPVKMTKGPMGRGAVRLRAPRDRLGIAEGIETALSASQIYAVPTWAVLGAKRLASIDVPDQVKQIIVFADAGEVGRREAFAAADAYERKGFDVEVVTPQAHHKNPDASDFNDCVRGVV